MTTQDLFQFGSLHRPWVDFCDKDKPHFTVSVQAEAKGPWVCLVQTNHFDALVKGYTAVHLFMLGHGSTIRVERLVQDEDDTCVYHPTLLEESRTV